MVCGWRERGPAARPRHDRRRRNPDPREDRQPDRVALRPRGRVRDLGSLTSAYLYSADDLAARSPGSRIRCDRQQGRRLPGDRSRSRWWCCWFPDRAPALTRDGGPSAGPSSRRRSCRSGRCCSLADHGREPRERPLEPVRGPVARAARQRPEQVGGFGLFVGSIAAVVSLFVRFRRLKATNGSNSGGSQQPEPSRSWGSSWPWSPRSTQGSVLGRQRRVGHLLVRARDRDPGRGDDRDHEVPPLRHRRRDLEDDRLRAPRGVHRHRVRRDRGRCQRGDRPIGADSPLLRSPRRASWRSRSSRCATASNASRTGSCTDKRSTPYEVLTRFSDRVGQHLRDRGRPPAHGPRDRGGCERRTRHRSGSISPTSCDPPRSGRPSLRRRQPCPSRTASSLRWKVTTSPPSGTRANSSAPSRSRSIAASR